MCGHRKCVTQWIYCNPWRGRQAHLQRRKAIKQPSSRGLCLKVTLGGQIDGISDGAKKKGGWFVSARKTGLTATYGWHVEWKAGFVYNRRPPSLERPFNWGACSDDCACVRRNMLCSAMCPLTVRSSKRFSCAHETTFCIKKKRKERKSLVLLGLCWIRALSDRPRSQTPPPPPLYPVLCALYLM